MPELPEVETVVRTLERNLKGQTIRDVNVIYPRILDNCDKENFVKKLVGQKFTDFSRRGKFLIFTLTDYILIAHLRMEGKFYIYTNEVEINKHTHVIFSLDDCFVHYNDVRKFGRFYLYKKDEKLEAISKLGYEPFDDNLTSDKLKVICRNNNTAIKTQLLDQSMIAGIGNIYADEIDYLADINPERKAKFISEDKWDVIISATKSTLAKAIQAGGTTIRSYTSSLGVTGLFQLSLNVHTREDEPCNKCGSIIKRIKLNGRSTYYCPNCQKKQPVVMAITGTIGSGKSTVTKLIEEAGIKTISCDEINRELLDSKETIEHLATIFKCDASILDKKYISDQIFTNKEIKGKVEEYLHKRILEEINDWIKSNQDESLLLVEVPLLFEVNWNKHFDFNITVVSDKETTLSRLVDYRGFSIEEATRRYDNQLPASQKVDKSDYVITNNGSISDLTNEVVKLLKKL